MTLFENQGNWPKNPSEKCSVGKEINGQIQVDLDARKAKLTIEGETMETSIAESITGISRIGFGAHFADTLFSISEIK